LLRDIAFISTPRVKYAASTQVTTAVTTSLPRDGTKSALASAAYPKGRVKDNRHGTSHPQSRGQDLMLSSPRQPPERSAADQGGLEDGKAG
jgi:hypothetical protein